MNAPDKAKELVYKMYNAHSGAYTFSLASNCALIAVDEILKITNGPSSFKYWQEVRAEIEKL